MDFLKSAVASAISKGPPFPYSFGDRLDLDQSVWTLFNGTKREDGSNCSIFSFDITANKSRLPLAKNAVRKLRTLRHPGIVRVLDTVETDTYIYVATERVTPLGWHVRRKTLSEETAKWGLYTIASTLRFINDEGSSVHGNVRVSSVFTSESGEWRIGGLEILSSMKEDDAVIYTYAGLVPDINRYAPPEVNKTGWDAIKKNPLGALDAYGYGLLIYEVFNGGSTGMDQPGQTKNIPPSMHQGYKRLLNANPKARLSTSHFLEQGKRSGGFFETPLIRLSEGIESLGLKSDGERAETLSELDEVSDDFPEAFFKMKILPELLKSVEFGGGGPKVFGYVMKIGAKLSDDEYETRLNPVIVRLFANPDRQIRVCLLDNLPLMIDHLPQKLISDKIFPQIATGFTDLAPVVRESTVKSILTIITKLPDRTINGEMLKLLAKTANDEQPGIRTNTTICMGKIARDLSPNTRQKVLIAAFTRSLRDPFIHARNAALQALTATSDIFSEEDCANRILPALCPSLVDKEKIVRDQANKSFDAYLSRIRRYGSTLPDTVLPPPGATSNANGGATTPRIGTPQNEGWAGWAISSFTNKIAAASGEMQASSNGLAVPTTSSGAANRSSSVPPSSAKETRFPSTASASNLQRQALQSPPAAPPLARASTDTFFGAAQEEDDELDAAWADMGDMGDDNDDTGDADKDDNAALFAAPRATSTTAALAPAASAFDDGGEPDFAGWLSAQAQAKSKAALPKGLSKPAAGSNAKAASTTKKPIVSAAKKPLVTATAKKAIDTKPKDQAGEDDWGDAWD